MSEFQLDQSPGLSKKFLPAIIDQLIIVGTREINAALWANNIGLAWLLAGKNVGLRKCRKMQDQK